MTMDASVEAAGGGGEDGEEATTMVDVYAVLDFEATCEDKRIDGGRFSPPEVIEFPTVLLDARTLEVIDEFRVYVRPVRNPILTPFCTSLTGIDQSTVDGGMLFKEALELHEEFMRRNSGLFGQERRCLFITCGNWDLKTMLPWQCELIGADVPDHFKTWANIKDAFKEVVPRRMPKRSGYFQKNLGMASMLSSLGLSLEGRHHSGLDDSKNIARIAAELCRRSRRQIRPTTGGRNW